MKKARSVGIHDGSFHADEVMACALLIIFGLVDEDKIVRTRDLKKLEECEYICDVGGVFSEKEKKFDHHQSSYQGNFSSAGMILQYLLNKNMISLDKYNFLYKFLIKGIDEQDNGKICSVEGMCSFSDVIKLYNSFDEKDKKFEEKGFKKALELSCSVLRRLIERFEYLKGNKVVIAKAMEKKSVFLELDAAMSWQDNFFALQGEKHPALFILFPSANNWILRGIPPSLLDKMKVRVPFPEEWSGLLDGDLEKKSGIKGGVFCHKGLFLSVWETREAAIEALIKTLNYRGISYGHDF